MGFGCLPFPAVIHIYDRSDKGILPMNYAHYFGCLAFPAVIHIYNRSDKGILPIMHTSWVYGIYLLEFVIYPSRYQPQRYI